MLDWQTTNPNHYQVATGRLKDGWTCAVQRRPGTDTFVATVVHPYGDALAGGLPWPIEDPRRRAAGAERGDTHRDTAHPAYSSIGEAMSGAERYVDRLSELHGYPDPDKMSASDQRPTLVSPGAAGRGVDGIARSGDTAHRKPKSIAVIPVATTADYRLTVGASTMDGAEWRAKDIQIRNLQTRVTALEAALEAGHIDGQFAILNRTGINQRWHRRPADADTVIFFDIDCIHDHNERWGYAVTDDHIRAVMSQIAHSWVFRWYSGDEFGLICAEPDAVGFAARVKRLLQKQGMTATFGIAPIVDGDLEKSMGTAAARVQRAKAKGMRGTISASDSVSTL